MRSEEAEVLRKRYAYRRLIVRGKLALHRHTAARMVGPDCAYHLYAMLPQPTPARRPDRGAERPDGDAHA